ncbi:Rossmann-like and DUF2520 domain-containing protein [Aquimarina sp. 2201CG5-10]|uniref:Rossmann-like and DUF2520 domain-containing protein n=1 Tax=Aquimarina callyspongiae TaxID=3098150 RepID=UPI002AB4E186|nr:DUF2520 domain-containing protein [Aquimarina sp. 2201CG5-10]MDY8138383.1 DUF2520 domain-containing protein [Aquimarina sp. 2201CG5-10]
MIRVVILGAGNVAQHLYAGLKKESSVQIIQCYNRKGIVWDSDKQKTTVVKDLNLLQEADVYILALSDNAIEEVSTNLSFQNRLVVHTSGSIPMKSIHNTNRRGVFYPLQTFSKEKEVNFQEIPFCIEAENKDDETTLKKLASTLSNKIYSISSEQRNVLHVSAVFVNNFTNYLMSTGKDICETHQVPFEILHPLIIETAGKATNMNPDEAQTGPAIRKDSKTIDRHLKILEDPTQIKIYKTLTEAIQSKYGKKL